MLYLNFTSKLCNLLSWMKEKMTYNTTSKNYNKK